MTTGQELARDNASIRKVQEAMDTLKAVRTFIMNEMVDSVDYGVIPGTGKVKVKGADGREVEIEKKNMLLPGAQKVIMFFNAYPRYKVESREQEYGHVEFTVNTELVSRTNGDVIGSGIGSCSTMEGKYRFRNADRVCPKCEAPAIIRGNPKFSQGREEWICWKNKKLTPGCGAVFPIGDPAIVGQATGKVENDSIYDLRNTVLKMAKKRSLVDAGIALGCLSDLFTQDLEDLGVYDIKEPAKEPEKPSGKPQEAQSPAPPAQDTRPTVEVPVVTETLTDVLAPPPANVHPFVPPTGKTQESFLADFGKAAEQADSYLQLTALCNQNYGIAAKLGVTDPMTNAKRKEFGRLMIAREDAEPLIAVPDTIPGDLYLEFYALDEVAQKLGVPGMTQVFHLCKDVMKQRGFATEWKAYAGALKKEVLSGDKEFKL